MMWFKNKMDSSWDLIKKDWGKVKKIGYLGYKGKISSVNITRYF